MDIWPLCSATIWVCSICNGVKNRCPSTAAVPYAQASRILSPNRCSSMRTNSDNTIQFNEEHFFFLLAIFLLFSLEFRNHYIEISVSVSISVLPLWCEAYNSEFYILGFRFTSAATLVERNWQTATHKSYKKKMTVNVCGWILRREAGHAMGLLRQQGCASHNSDHLSFEWW